MSTGKRYREVSEMVRDASASNDFVESLEKRLAGRQLIKHLIVLRTAQGLSQADIANKLGCTQSRVSKLESSCDADLCVGDLLRYADALGLQPQLVFYRKGNALADTIRFHFYQTKKSLERLVELAKVDTVIAKGIANFFAEAGLNFMNLILRSAKALPASAQEEIPFITIPGTEETEEHAEAGSADTVGEKDHGRKRRVPALPA